MQVLIFFVKRSPVEQRLVQILMIIIETLIYVKHNGAYGATTDCLGSDVVK